MEITHTDFPDSIRADLNVAYEEGRVAGAKSEYRSLLSMEPSSSNAKKVTFYGSDGNLRPFTDERQPQKFNEYNSFATLREWEGTREVRSSVLDDDQTGGKLRRRVKSFGQMISKDHERRTYEYLRDGVSKPGFDTEPYFSTNHYYVTSSGNTISDVDAQSNVNWGASQVDATTVQIAKRHFAELEDDRGNPWLGELTHLVVRRGSENAKTAKELQNSTFTVEAYDNKGANTVNVFKGDFEVVEVDYGLGSSTNNTSEWMALDLSRPDSKPMIMLTHSVSPGFENMQYSQLLEDSDTGFWREVFAFGVYGRYDWNVGDWRTAYMNGSSHYAGFSTDDNEGGRMLIPNQSK